MYRDPSSVRQPERPHSSAWRTAAFIAVTLLVGLSGAFGFQVREPSRFDPFVIPDPGAVVSPELSSPETAEVTESARAAWSAFKATNGDAWDLWLDTRSGAPLLVQGQGIPMLPGSGNALRSAEPVTLESVEARIRAFMAEYAGLFRADDAELILARDASGDVTHDLWQVVFDRVVRGVPVSGDRYVFYIGHGNLIAFGATRWSKITAAPTPSVAANDALERLFAHIGLTGTESVAMLDTGSLAYTPIAAPGTAPESYAGPMGEGYASALTWSFAFSVDDDAAVWVGLVDAHSGEVLAFYDDAKYAQVKGGVFPVSDDGSCPSGCEQANYAMPFANVTVGGSPSTASSMGSFACTGGTATTTLAGPYFRVVDGCGAISQSVTCDADINLGTSAGTDCAVPSGASAGDTHATRTSFYHLNRINEHARAYLPANAWLGQQVTDNTNINLTCNARWNGAVNLYRSSASCRNTGEIAGVILHEWGHGFDQNDGGGYDNPSEAYGDITALLATRASCVGRGFYKTGNCGGYGNPCLSCTGIRDQDWNQRANHTPSTPEGFIAGCDPGFGPCGKEEHCEGYLAGETIWDLSVRDLPAAGIDQTTAWQLVDRLWYKSRQGSGGNAYSCGSPASTRSCSATSWFSKLRVIDDDDGNLANGTPHAAAIFAAFNRHNIPCGAAGDPANQSTTTCPSLAAPVVTATPS